MTGLRLLTDAEHATLPARLREVVEYRKSGLSLNHVAGCPLECAYCIRHEYGGFGAALGQIFGHRDMPHVWVNTISVGAALLGFNALSVVRRHLGEGGLTRLFFAAPAPQVGASSHESPPAAEAGHGA